MESIDSMLTLSQWTDMFIVAMGVLVLLSLVAVLCLLAIILRLNDIKQLLASSTPPQTPKN